MSLELDDSICTYCVRQKLGRMSVRLCDGKLCVYKEKVEIFGGGERAREEPAELAPVHTMSYAPR